jgi:hypothetical protein
MARKTAGDLTIKDIRVLLRRKPFEPFRVRFITGAHYASSKLIPLL